jgi:hypothetical protein
LCKIGYNITKPCIRTHAFANALEHFGFCVFSRKSGISIGFCNAKLRQLAAISPKKGMINPNGN